MNEEHKQAIRAGVSRFMTGLAIERRCPACGRRAALSRRLYSQITQQADGHWCLYSTATCRYCKHVDTRPCYKCDAG